MSQIRLPNFVLVGIQRSGTTWLYEVLRNHPDVFLPYVKEVHFFDNNFEKGIEWYRNHYIGVKSETCIGDITPNYIHNKTNASRIFSLIPECKILIILRNPVDYLFSLYNHRRIIENGIGSFESFIEDPKNLDYACFYKKTIEYYRLFSSEQIHLAYYEDFVNDRKSYLKAICSFLEIDLNRIDVNYERLINQTVIPRFEVLHRIAHQLVIFSRKIDSKPLQFLHKRIRPLLNNPIYMKQIGYKKEEELDISIKSKLIDYYYKDVFELSQFVGRDLIRFWDLLD